jgi:hypothetical protein
MHDPPESPSTTRRKILALAGPVALAVVWLTLIVTASPRGEFPIIDDWSYAQSTWWTVEAGRVRLHDFTSMPLLTHVAIGSAWTLAFGKSFEALRTLTLTFGLAGILSLYALGRELGAPRWAAFLSALTLALNPLYFMLSCSYMTDVPFCALSIVSLWLFVAGYNSTKPRAASLLLAGAFAVALAATLERQVGLALSISFAVALGMRSRDAWWKRLALALPTVISVVGLVGYERWLAYESSVPSGYHLPIERIQLALDTGIAGFVLHVFGNASEAILLLAMLSIPIALLLAANRSSWEVKLLWGVFSVVIAVRIASLGVQAPFNAESLFDLGIGVIAMYNWVSIQDASLWWPILLFVTTASIFSAGVWCGIGLSDLRSAARNPLAIAAALFLALSMFPLIAGEFRDRYLLVPLSIVLVLGAVHLGRLSARTPAIVLIVLLFAGLAWYTVAGVHDLFAMNRVRWSILADLSSSGIDPKAIDGGYEFNGLNTYYLEPGLKHALGPGKSPYWVVDDEWIVALAPEQQRDYEIVNSYEVDHWLSDDLGQLFLLRRRDSPALPNR